jgi:hypothetical protein
MKQYVRTITFILMGVFIYFTSKWVQPLKVEMGLTFYLLIAVIGAGSYAIAEALVKAMVLTSEKLDGAKA